MILFILSLHAAILRRSTQSNSNDGEQDNNLKITINNKQVSVDILKNNNNDK